ncbi:MAG TPA: hypothetical protein VK859_02985, partial [bacterium]|nr:hypothetical protein [bacterium]
MAPSTTQSPSLPVSDPPKFLAVFFFAALFFLCGADQYFATRLGGFNFRWGQILLLAVVPFSLKRDWALFRGHSQDGIFAGRILKYWGIFFAVYALTAVLSENPKFTLIKWGWGLFNIGCAAVVLLDSRWRNSLPKGFLFGATALALLVWAQAIAVYWLGATAPSIDWRFTYPLLIHNSPFPLGYVQPGPFFDQFPILRMDAFYYEPSYAGCALAFAFPLVLIVERSLGPKRFPFSSALVLSSILLVGSRSGILSAFTGLLVFFAYIRRNSLPEIKPYLWKTLGAAFLSLVLFGLSTDARKYMEFNCGLFQDR